MLELHKMKNVEVPVQILPSGLPYDYQYFPRTERGFAVRRNKKTGAKLR